MMKKNPGKNYKYYEKYENFTSIVHKKLFLVLYANLFISRLLNHVTLFKDAIGHFSSKLWPPWPSPLLGYLSKGRILVT